MAAPFESGMKTNDLKMGRIWDLEGVEHMDALIYSHISRHSFVTQLLTSA